MFIIMDYIYFQPKIEQAKLLEIISLENAPTALTFFRPIVGNGA